jgi:hypothetical protein
MIGIRREINHKRSKKRPWAYFLNKKFWEKLRTLPYISNCKTRPVKTVN